MAAVHCPMCGKLNPPELDVCQFCGARIKPILASRPDNSRPIQAGENPIESDASDLERIDPGKADSIHPGEVPTKKNTSDLERALPSWLRSLRGKKDSAENGSKAEPTSEDSFPAGPTATPNSEPPEALPDWLTGLDKAASEDEEVPDWLAGLRSETPADSSTVPDSQAESTPELGNQDWMARLGGELQAAPIEPPVNEQPSFGTPPQPASDDSTPDWLKSLQSGESNPQQPPAASQGDENLPDWFSGLSAISADSPPAVSGSAEPSPAEDLPDWLNQLKEKNAGPEPTTPVAGEESTPDWLSGLGTIPGTPESAPSGSIAGEESTPDWLSGLGTIPGTPESTPSGSVAGGESTPSWLTGFGTEPGTPEPASSAPEGESTPSWLSGFGTEPATPEPASSTPEGESTPSWLSGFGTEPGTPEPASSAPEGESTPSWLSGFGTEPGTPEPASSTSEGESTPSWLTGLGAASAAPEPAPGEKVPDWLSNLESKSDSGSDASAAFQYNESETSGRSAEETPSWLSQLQADFNAAEDVEKHKDDYEVVSGSSARKDTGPLPEWLAGIEPASPPSGGPPPSGGTPALIVEDKEHAPGETGDTAFSMEAPDWLNKLKPDQAVEKSAENEEEQSHTDDLKAAELPSWVQAMRPVESVVADAKTTALNEDQVMEKIGPLAGLVGVLPSGPGLGSLRKPPAYSGKLLISEGQQRYVASFDRLVASETISQTSKTTRLTSNRLWRWLIALILVVAVALPFVANTHITPPTSPSLLPSDQGATSALIEAIPSNAPVLIAFDYEPALSGELEAAAAPLVDKLQSKGSRLTLVSTSPTGPALAERFLQTTLLVNSHQYTSDEQYLNLGYIAGGPAGISYFAGAPADAMPFTVNGKPAWAMPPLQGVLHLSDFAAVIILTDNADTGRNWVEQSGQYLGKTPMVMIISAQAEPMIQPYFDSGQLKGLVSGLSDAKIYEQGFNRPGLAYHYWDSFSIGILVAEILIGIGATWSALLAWRLRRKESGEEA